MISIAVENMLQNLVNNQVAQTYHGLSFVFEGIAGQIHDDFIWGIRNDMDDIEDFLEDAYDAKFPINNTANNGAQMYVQPLVVNAIRLIRKYCRLRYGMRL